MKVSKTAFVFPGQGSQAVGMGGELASAFATAREVFQEVDDVLGQHLSRLMLEGPEEELKLTENTQPALMAVSLAVVRVLETEYGVSLAQHAAFLAGHSLGEYSALTAAGSLALADTTRLLKRRGQAMQAAVPVGEGAMAAILGVDLSLAEEIAKQAAAETGQVCDIANDNAPGQIVLSGHREAVEHAITLGQGRGTKRSILLPVSAPFHCTLMASAAKVVADAFEGVTIRMPMIPVVANVTAHPVSDPATIRAVLLEQVAGRVRWRESIEYLKAQGVSEVYELGAGKVLTGLTRRIDREIAASAAETPAEIEILAKILNA